jgi:thioredoxin-related protein
MPKPIFVIIAILLGLYIMNSPDLNIFPWSSCYKSHYEAMLDNSSKTIIFFFRPGCPHCENMMDAWGRLKKSMLKDDYKFQEIDTSSAASTPLASKYGVTGVPHIVLANPDGGYKVYSGDRSTEDILSWVLKPDE